MPSAPAFNGTTLDRYALGYRNAHDGSPSEPNPKQALAHASPADELLYGGAAFGGKSEWTIWDAIATCLEVPNADVAVFRRTLKELEDDLIERFLKYVPRWMAKYNDQKKTARFYNGSRMLFRYCDVEKDVYRYQSAQWVALYIDQAEHFTHSMVLYLFSRVRTSVRGVHPKIRLTANPGGIGHVWLKDRYISPPAEVTGDRSALLPGELWRPVPNPSIVDDKPLSRQFIQALMTDNVKGMEADPVYVQRIRANPNEAIRRMLEDGDWDAFDGQAFPTWKQQRLVTTHDEALLDAGLAPGQVIPWHVIPDPFWQPPPHSLIYGSVDYGYGNPWSAKFHAAMADGHYVAFKEFYGTKVRDRDQARRIAWWITEAWAVQDDARQPRWKFAYIIMDSQMWNSRAEYGLSKSIADVYVDELGPLGINVIPTAKGPGSRKARYQRMLEALSPGPDGFPWCQWTTACPNFIRTLPQLIIDPNDPDDILHGTTPDRKQDDHCYDDESYFLNSRPDFPKPAKQAMGRDAYYPLGFEPRARRAAR
jgi:hypothetical protein